MDSDADGEITNYVVMTRTNMKEKQANEGQKSPKKKVSVRYAFEFVEKIHWKENSKKNQIAIDGTENTVKTDTGKILH